NLSQKHQEYFFLEFFSDRPLRPLKLHLEPLSCVTSNRLFLALFLTHCLRLRCPVRKHHDFDAAVFLGAKCLIKIWSVAEVSGSVTDNNGRIYPSLLNEPHQLVHVLVNVGLARFHRQSLVHKSAHRCGDRRSDIDAWHRNNSAWPTR